MPVGIEEIRRTFVDSELSSFKIKVIGALHFQHD